MATDPFGSWGGSQTGERRRTISGCKYPFICCLQSCTQGEGYFGKILKKENICEQIDKDNVQVFSVLCRSIHLVQFHGERKFSKLG